MNRTQFKNFIIGLALSIGLFPACGDKPSDNEYKQRARYFAADESLSPVIDEELDIFNMKNKRDSIYAIYTNEQDAIEKLLNREVLLVFTTRTLTPKEEEIIKSYQYKPLIYPLAYDALALIVHKNNPDSMITVDNPKSATLKFVVDSIMQGKKVKTDGNVQAAMTSAEVVKYVEEHENAIGVIGSIWLNDQRDTTNLIYNRTIKVMRVSRATEATRANSYTPDQYNIAYGYYPMIRTIYAISTDPRSGGVPRGFANFCWLPNPGQLIFWNAGLFPARADYSVRDVVIN